MEKDFGPLYVPYDVRMEKYLHALKDIRSQLEGIQFDAMTIAEKNILKILNRFPELPKY